MAFHRNGSGPAAGFCAVRFHHADDGNMIAIVFPPEARRASGEPDWLAFERGEVDVPLIAVLNVDRLPDVGPGNTWRSGRYASALYRAIDEWETKLAEDEGIERWAVLARRTTAGRATR
jgi:hypothetical protein